MNCFKKLWNSRVALWVMIIAFVFAFLIGGLAGSIGAEASEEKEVLIYGQPDGKIFEGELPGTYKAEFVDFKPLDVPMDASLQEFIFTLSTAYEIDHTLVMAMIQTESCWIPDVISPGGDYGLMQINEINHTWLTRELGIDDFLDPEDNVKSGMFILRKLFEKYESPEKVLMAYNLGEGGAAMLWEEGIYETNYTHKVLNCQRELVG